MTAVDGHFLHGRWHFSTAPDSPKVWHLRARPATSAAYTPRDGYGVFCHGRAVPLEGSESETLTGHLAACYDVDPDDEWGEIAAFRIDPHWMTAFAMTDEEMAEIEAAREARAAD